MSHFQDIRTHSITSQKSLSLPEEPQISFLCKIFEANYNKLIIQNGGGGTLKNADGIYHTILHLFLVHVISTDSDAKRMKQSIF